jgi:hypothetical protein
MTLAVFGIPVKTGKNGIMGEEAFIIIHSTCDPVSYQDIPKKKGTLAGSSLILPFSREKKSNNNYNAGMKSNENNYKTG